MENILSNKINYLNKDIKFLLSTYVREYDMSKSNISILRYKGYLSEEQFEYYSNLPKMQRQVEIGMIQRDHPEVVDLLKEGMREIKNRFIVENGLDISNVLSIKNDAFFIINIVPRNTIINGVEFRLKNTYTSYYNVNGLELYYGYNQITDEEVLDVKGISENKLKLHEGYFKEFLETLFYIVQVEGVKEGMSVLTNIYEKYIKKQLHINYYREFNQISKIRVNVMGKEFYADYFNQNEIGYVNIGYNLNFMRELSVYYSSLLK